MSAQPDTIVNHKDYSTKPGLRIIDLPQDQWHLLIDAFSIPESVLPNSTNAVIRAVIDINTNKIMHLW